MDPSLGLLECPHDMATGLLQDEWSGTRWPSLISHQHDLRHKTPCFSILSLSYLLKQLARGPQDCCGFGWWGPSTAGSLSEAALPLGSGAVQWRRREETPSQEFQLCGNAGSILPGFIFIRVPFLYWYTNIHLRMGCVSLVQCSFLN